MARPKFTPIRSDDPHLNRVQDAIAKAMQGSNGVTIPSAEELPAPAAESAFAVLALVSNGSPTRVVVCLPNKDGGYEWVGFAQSS